MNDACYPDGHGQTVGLLLTYRCNLDCRYCYVRHKQDKDMSPETVKSILEPFLFDEENGWLDVIFVGGETLMAFDVIKSVVEWTENISSNRQVRFFGSTNGTLLNDERKTWLLSRRKILTLGLSYDGLPLTQLNNRGTDNIDTDFFITAWPDQPVQMTVDADSVEHMADGVIYLLEKGAAVHPNVAFEEKQWSDDSVMEYGRQLGLLADYYESHPGLPPISQFVHNLKEYADNIGNAIEQTRMCGAGEGYQVFDTNGMSYPCHILSPLVLSGEKLEDIKNGKHSSVRCFADPECSGCPYVTACPTCMACNYLYRGNFQSRDSTHCRIMKTEVMAFMKKEVLRLSSKKTLTSEDATVIDSICKLQEYENFLKS